MIPPSITGKWEVLDLKIIICFMFFIISAGCAKKAIVKVPDTDTSIRTGVEGKGFEDLSPRAQASLRLTEQARDLLEQDRADDAIMVLERAMNLNPANGLNYYYLSEAWLLRGMVEKAKKFNVLAASVLEASPIWMERVREQRERIDKKMDLKE